MLNPLFLCLLIASLVLTACKTQETEWRNQEGARLWLAANPASGHTRLGGDWKVVEGLLGSAHFNQNERHITGLIGIYTVEGHLKSDVLYLVLSQGGTAFYSAVLKKKDGVLTGFTSSQFPFSTKDSKKIVLTRSRD
ncbi:MAG: hypothetical protein WCG66_00335 [bacterium]